MFKSRGARAVFQFYPEDSSQVELVILSWFYFSNQNFLQIIFQFVRWLLKQLKLDFQGEL